MWGRGQRGTGGGVGETEVERQSQRYGEGDRGVGGMGMATEGRTKERVGRKRTETEG